jgi:hypothetical protein
MKSSRGLYVVPLLLALGLPGAALAKRVSLGLNYGQTATLLSNKTVAAMVECVLDDGGSDRVRVFATTTLADSYLDGSDDLTGNGSYLQPGTPATDSELLSFSAETGTESIGNVIDNGFVYAPDGRFVTVQGESAILGLNLVGNEFDCIVSVDIQKGRKFKKVK